MYTDEVRQIGNDKNMLRKILSILVELFQV